VRRFYRIGKLKQRDCTFSVQIKQNKSVIVEKTKNKDRKTVEEKKNSNLDTTVRFQQTVRLCVER
jgi:hypothetical protein